MQLYFKHSKQFIQFTSSLSPPREIGGYRSSFPKSKILLNQIFTSLDKVIRDHDFIHSLYFIIYIKIEWGMSLQLLQYLGQ